VRTRTHTHPPTQNSTVITSRTSGAYS
jgi:hypothetical protein